jgi:thiamine biosynthesis lipoprotein
MSPRARVGVGAGAFLLLPILISPILFSCANESRVQPASSAPRMFSRSGFSMGTTAEIKIAAADSMKARAALDAAYAELARIEALATIHDPQSAASKLNAAAGDGRFIETGADLDAILTTALRTAEKTGGAFDPTIGPLVRLWGFPGTPSLPDSSAIEIVLPLVGYSRLLRDPASGSGQAKWRLADPGMQIDLGGIACGYGIDRAAEILRRASSDFLINIGGDILVSGKKPDSTPWTIAIQHPRDPSAYLMTLSIPRNLAVSTSGDYEHFALIGGVRRHHILDPSTGYPSQRCCSVTVFAPDGVRSDAWSKAAFVLGLERGLQTVEEDPDLEGVFVAEEKGGRLVVRETTGIAKLRVHSGAAPARSNG